MSEAVFLTTRTKHWGDRMPLTPPQWTTEGNGFYLKFGEADNAVPLEHVKNLGRNVFKKRCKETGEEVAVKEMDYPIPETKIELHKEVEILRGLKHYHCIRVLGCYTHQDWFCIVTQPVANCDLMHYLSQPTSERVKSLGCGPPAIFLPKIMGCLAYTLHYIHEDPKVRHRDIKPENILLKGGRVLFADFGLSKTYTETQTGTTGPSAKTRMYTSPERAQDKHRNKGDDIFSLACVFTEIFTVYKGRSTKDFLSRRKERDPHVEKEGCFHRTVPAVIEWLEELATQRSDVQIIHLLRKMLDRPDRRPSAEHVWRSLTTCTAGNDTFFCGPCCMPLVYYDPILANYPPTDLSKALYADDLSTTKGLRVSTDKYFKQHYGKDQQLDLRWVRNLRQWNYSILDVVKDGTRPHLLARKRLQASENSEFDASIYAKNEAKILREMDHRHIVQLYGTYLQGNIHTLLYEPAADRDLRSYLELVALEYQRNKISSKGKEFDFLTRSFGCLANAVAHLHKRGYDHNDIRPENILVHDIGEQPRIFLSKFSFGLKSERGASAGGNILRFINRFGNLSLTRSSQDDKVPRSKNEKILTGQYRAPGQEATLVGQPAADVFALGCVFLEMCTVLRGRKVRDFEAYRANSEGDIAYCNTISRALKWQPLGDMKEVLGVIKGMVNQNAEQRPTALEISQALRKCKNSNGTPFVGDCSAS